MLKDEEREYLIKYAQAAHKKALEAAYGLGKCLVLIKEHEPREIFIEILGRDLGLTEIDGEAICKNMRLEEHEAAVNIAEIMFKAALRLMEGTDD